MVTEHDLQWLAEKVAQLEIEGAQLAVQGRDLHTMLASWQPLIASVVEYVTAMETYGVTAQTGLAYRRLRAQVALFTDTAGHA